MNSVSANPPIEKPSLGVSILRLLVVGVTTAALIVSIKFGYDELLRSNYRVTLAASEEALRRDRHSLSAQHQRIAAQQTIELLEEHLLNVKTYKDRFELLTASMKAVPKELADELYCEFGVYKGTTITHIAKVAPNRTIHGFDSFEGLPEDWRPGFEAGTFGINGLPVVPDNVKLHKGWFDQSLPVWLKSHPGKMAFMHLDADLYSSTKTVLDLCAERIVPGTILQFDEFFNYPGWKHGEYKAFMEFVKQHNVRFKYIGYTIGDNAEQVALQIESIQHNVQSDLTPKQ